MARIFDYWPLISVYGDDSDTNSVIAPQRVNLWSGGLEALMPVPEVVPLMDIEYPISKHIGSVCCCGPCESRPDPFDKLGIPDPREIASSIPDDITTTEAIVVGTPRQEGIDFSGDKDWFSVTLTAGVTYEISVAGAAHGSFSALTDSLVGLYNSAGELIGLDDDGGRHTSLLGFFDGLLTFTAAETGTYFIEADAFGSATGGYTISVSTRAADSVSNGPDTTDVHIVGGTTTGSIDYNADQDWFAVDLVAGETYEFILNIDGANTLPDGYLTFHDANGVRLSVDDDGGPGLGSRIVWTAETSGTYFVSAQGFTGNSTVSTGTYTLTSGLTAPPSPLDAIDWGTALAGSTVEVYFAGNGETFDGTTSLGWDQFEIDAVMAALNEISESVNLTFVITTNAADAEFKLLTFDFNSDADPDNDGVLGFFGPPSTGSGTGIGVFGRTSTGWSQSGLEKGGFGYVTLIHELGHGLGLAHPHDTGGSSSVLQGVSGSGDSGLFELNQGVYTTMSYVDGWATAPHGASGSTAFGWQATMMAFDLAILQQKYGAVDRNTGDTVYTLPDSNAAGTFYELIWDTGGIDTLQYDGSDSAFIDLRAATLLYEEGGGGFVSYATGIFGGFTIANSVVIENAVGGSASDTLTGNAADNSLRGNAGDDTLNGGDGVDTAVFAGVFADYTITEVSATEFTVAHNNGGSDGTDTLFFVEFAAFSDQTVDLSNLPAPDQFTENADQVTGTSGDDDFDALGGNDIVNGAAGNDTISGNTGNDELRGGTGADILNGDAGDDTLFGDSGNDTLSGGADNDELRGGDGDDTLNGGIGADMLYGEVGNDALNGGDGNDFLDGGADNDVLFGGSGNDDVRGGVGNDTLHGESGIDNLSGGDGDDLLNGGSENDVLRGGIGVDTLNGDAGDDRLLGEAGNDTLNGGDGVDYLDGGADNDELRGGIGNDELRGNTGSDTLFGEAGNDRLFGGNAVDTLDGGADDDYLDGGGNDDTLIGGDGDDEIRGNIGSDTIDGGLGDDLILGGAGFDTIDGGDGNDVIRGGNGNDSILGSGGDDNIAGQDGQDTIDGGAGNDLITGGNNADVLRGNIGADTLRGGGGNDQLFGGNSDDRLEGDAEDDYLDGGGGNDTLIGGSGNDEIRGNVGSDTIDGGTGNDLLLAGGGFDTVNGGDGADTLRGGNGDDMLYGDDGNDNIAGQIGRDFVSGGDGDDIITGGDNADSLFGDRGNDRISGDGGADLLSGGEGADILTGGASADVFVFNQGDSLLGTEDLVTDLVAGEIIALSTHTFVGDGAFSGTGQFEVRYVSGATTLIELDYDGNGIAEEVIQITGDFAFTSDGEQLTAIVSSPDGPDMFG